MYVGKAKNLKNRVKSYTQVDQLTQQKQQLVLTAARLKHRVLESELEALLIEAELIRLHQPKYNILLKDDKTPLYIKIRKIKFPSVQLVRKSDLKLFPNSAIKLGPFSSAYKLKQVLRIARKIFPWCDIAEFNTVTKEKSHSKSCFYYHLDLCPGACIGKISAEEYQQNIDHLILFLKGQKKEVILKMKKQMEQLANELEFEQAANVKQKIAIIEDVTNRMYQLRPNLILPALHDNYHQHALDHLRRILLDLGIISPNNLLSRIEGFDVSNLMGQEAAVSMVVFSEGQPNKNQYRLFNIKVLNTPNDYQMMKQAIARRCKHPEWTFPDLIVVDGGRGQVRATLIAYQEFKIKNTPIIGIEKNPDRLVIPTKIESKKNNLLEIQYRIIKLPSDHPALHLAQQIRDESHRFAKKQHSKLKRKAVFGS